MKLLVTGGAGFIGTNFTKYWLKEYKKDKIVSIDSLTYAANKDEYLKMNKKEARFTGDICDICSPAVESYIEECDCIVHFAAESHVDNSIINSSPFIQTNIVGTHNLLEFAVKYDKRFHYISTDEVFGSLPLDGGVFTEDTPYNPRSPYSASKASSDHLVRSYYHTHGLRATISNCGNNYGPWQHKEKFIPLSIKHLINNIPIPVYGTGDNIRSWVHVQDHCSAIEAILTRGKIGETYLVGCQPDSEVSNMIIVNKLLSIFKLDESYITFVDDRKGHDKRYAIDGSKLKNLGWSPKINLDDGLNITVDWYKSH